MNVIKAIAVILAVLLSCASGRAATPLSARSGSDVRMVVVLSRHGVRSPTHPTELQAYANQPWPTWSGKPGDLTERGALLMRQFGTYYRGLYAGMLGGERGCPPAGSVFVWADVDERTVATGNAFLAGFAPGCGIPVGHAPGDPDELFDPLPGVGVVSKVESKASILGAVGGSFAGLADAYGSAFATMEQVLGCDAPATCKQISQVPTSVANDGDGGLAGLSGGLDIAADVAENMLLEYTNGNPDVGWGRADRSRLLEMLQLHILAKRLEHGNRYAARAHSSNIMAHTLQTLREGATGRAAAGTLVPLRSRFVFLSGHDTQLAEISGLLGLSWSVSGDQFNDTPPGSALIFELHKAARGGAQPFLRTFFVAQTLDAMRAGHGEEPVRVPVYVPGCPSFDCTFATFDKIVERAIDPGFVAPWGPHVRE